MQNYPKSITVHFFFFFVVMTEREFGKEIPGPVTMAYLGWPPSFSSYFLSKCSFMAIPLKDHSQ